MKQASKSNNKIREEKLEIWSFDDIHLDLFEIRWNQEIKKRLGDDWLDSKDETTYMDAMFMTVWNRINSMEFSTMR